MWKIPIYYRSKNANLRLTRWAPTEAEFIVKRQRKKVISILFFFQTKIIQRNCFKKNYEAIS
ncbi:hypothetical protein BES34_003570 [Leptospira inadai serovar Lyme]|uniref:Uncharacterized protein n=1 Tax=Leptospira inadai serovar Lyme TaxID=293084 RepID=A0ABX4YNE6_9LEPT|nr:hypothetical protein BES34_003570 [Leptospira inadai serovar Lyme]